MINSALLYGLYKLTSRNDEVTTPNIKVEEPAAPKFQPARHVQNVSIIPEGEANINNDPRDVFIASRVVLGGAGGGALGLIEKYGFGALKAVTTLGLTVALDDAPDPTHHWCVVVGDYLHQLQSTSFWNGWNYYTNEEFSMSGGWTKYKLGVTNFNDAALVNTASKVMNEMPEVYNFIDNNCQHFSLRMLDRILRDGRKKVKKFNQTYGQMRMEPYPLLNTTKVYKIGEEPTEEDNQKVQEPAQIKPKPVEPVVIALPTSEEEDDVDDTPDRNGDIAVIDSEVDHLRLLEEAVSIMIQNTPTMRDIAQST
ncbi:hypothetical protein HJFPF1_07513 [Paramyrothecium foliicola]|nr:hypothetical protein HJFPF1_07513 [Paramyrothecium foliicola]